MTDKWSYQNAIDYAKQERKEHPIPWVKISQDADKDLDFADVITANNKELAMFMSVYGGNKAILEQVVATHEMKLGAMKAQFDEGYNVAFAEVIQNAKGKKPTRDEARGIIMGSNKFLGELFNIQLITHDILNENIEICIENISAFLKIDPKGNTVDDNITCLTKIMKTVKNKEVTNQFNNDLIIIKNNKLLPMRLKFMIMDIL